MLRAENLSKSYRRGFLARRRTAVRGVHFAVAPGELVGLAGPNGAGKTTVFKLCAGLLRPDSGRVTLWGLDASHPVARRRLGFLPETTPRYPFLSVRGFLEVQGRLAGMANDGLAQAVENLWSRLGGGLDYLDWKMSDISKGWLRRAGLAQALLHRPALLILDEPMEGLDVEGRECARQVLWEHRKAGGSALLSSHFLPDLQTLSDRILALLPGREGADPA